MMGNHKTGLKSCHGEGSTHYTETASIKALCGNFRRKSVYFCVGKFSFPITPKRETHFEMKFQKISSLSIIALSGLKFQAECRKVLLLALNSITRDSSLGNSSADFCVSPWLGGFRSIFLYTLISLLFFRIGGRTSGNVTFYGFLNELRFGEVWLLGSTTTLPHNYFSTFPETSRKSLF